MGIWSAIGNLLKIVAYFFDPNVRARAERKRVWSEFQGVQLAYRQALANRKPQEAAILGKQMEDMRNEYAFISVYEYGTKEKK